MMIMKNVLRTTLILAVSASLLIGCNLIGSPVKGHFSQQVADIDEPQTDDERTMVGEFNDYLLLTDSLAEIWNGTDTLTMRRLMYNIDKQKDRVEKTKKFQNVRRSMGEKIDEQTKKIWNEIEERFSIDLIEELNDFYFYIEKLDKFGKVRDGHRPHKREKVYQNTMGEYYVLRPNYKGKLAKVPVYFEDGKYYEDFFKPIEPVELVNFKSVDIEREE